MYGPIYRLRFSYIYFTVNISGPEQLEQILLQTKNNKKGQTYKFVTRWLGEGLLTSSGTKWQKHRKILTPSFHFKMLEEFLRTFHAETEKLVNLLQKETEQPWTDILPIISKMALLSITDTAMGISLNEEESDADQKYIATMSQLRDVLFERFTRPWLYRNFIYYTFTSLGHLEKKLISDLQSFTDNIIKERKKTFKWFEFDDDTSWISNGSRKSKFVFLDILLNAFMYKQSIDDQGIRDEVNTFTFEGHDTTSVGMCLTLMLLANHGDYQNKIYQEIIEVIGDNSEPNINLINKLKLMDRFIKESLRLYPVLPFISRKLEEDVTIDGYLLPKGILINIHLFDVHRNEKYWPDPEKFDPDRFLPENCANRHPLAYIPFSAGSRNCIGK
uniref:Cytochrome P450 4C1-like n=1 Tax=Diabrotica virgifera virgifera TaxID=50390 RepID=A0A6P7H5Q4_DIAVI